MEYKVGDRVRIKDLGWYDENKDEYGYIECGKSSMNFEKSQLCGKIVTISRINDATNTYRIEEDNGFYDWTDEMIECKVEEETKPELKYKVGDKVRIKSIDWYILNKDKDGFVHCGDSVFDNYMSVFCGSVVTIGGVGLYGYDILEDMHCRTWTDEMIKGLVEEETKPKFKVGDEITNGKATLSILNLLSEKYVVKYNFGECGILYFNSQDGWKIVEEETKPNVIEEAKTYWDNIKDAWICPEGYIFKDENGNVIPATKIVLEKKKKEYPKTYEECCQVLGISDGEFMFDGLSDDEYDLFDKFVILKRCRDAYWKIAGEEMGLGKPWEPDWKNYNDYKFVIGVFENEIIKCYNTLAQYVFAFPTEEMRDAFYENFKEEIEICKELL